MTKNSLKILIIIFSCVIGYLIYSLAYFNNKININPEAIFSGLILFTSFFLSIQGIFTLIWMLYAWENPESINKQRSPNKYLKPNYSFTALIPARHEEKVIEDTIKAVNRISYPNNLKEILILCRSDDVRTIKKVKQTLKNLVNKNIKLVVFDSNPINKPHALNIGLTKAKNEIVAIFDAEDEPHPEIYNVINTIMTSKNADVVQSGVQLMNFKDKWFSSLCVLEYFFWFKSGLHFFSNIGKATPLGGNTVFFKKKYLEKIGGWDENCLTEDADIGIRLTLNGAITRIVYDERHTTREEAPSSVASFIKQRTRWNQGFLQIFLKGDWNKYSYLKQKLTILYVILTPVFQSLLLFYMPLGLILALTCKLSVLITLFSFIPLYLFVIQIITYTVGLYEFTKGYQLSFPLHSPIKIILAFYPYQFLLAISSFRAFYRIVSKNNKWEKTLHLNKHRQLFDTPLLTQYAR